MGIFSRIISKVRNRSPTGQTIMKMITVEGESGYFGFDGVLYHSDIVRSAVRPYASAVGKAVPKHIRRSVDDEGNQTLQVNPEPYIRFLLEEPNPYMTGQELQERMAAQLKMNNNAFAVVTKDEFGYPEGIYPLNATAVQKIYDKSRRLFLKFWFKNGSSAVFPYDSIIHLRNDFYEDDTFGTSPKESLLPLMEVVETADQGIVKAIKNSAVIRWLLTFNTSLRPEDLKKQAKEFVTNYLSVESDSLGVAATDTKADAKQVEPKDYVPPVSTMKNTIDRIYKVLGTNEKIVSSAWSEDDYNAYFESEIEPALMKFERAYTTRIFSRRARGCGNSIVFESFNLSTASMATKLALKDMVDRKSMTPNEWRAAFNMAPVPGGDQLLLRKDTGVEEESRGDEHEEN